MSELKCPFCQQKLRNCCAGVIYTCSKPDSCPHEQCYGSKELWQVLTDSMEEHDLCHDALVERTKELDRTRKALDAALDKLKRIQKIYTNAPFNAPVDYANVCTDMYDVATEQITALEQKDK